MPPQITRLILLTVGIVTAYVLARAVLTPKSFGEYGWYRGDALREISALPAAYAGSAACADCHGPVLEKKRSSKHKNVACESCHGASNAHTEDPSIAPKKDTRRQFCLRCHQADISRPAKFPQVEAAEHFSDSKCVECHLPHAPTEAPTQ